MATLRIDIWSDLACPWCYLGKRRLEQALARFPHREQVELVWRSFELNPSAPLVAPDPAASYAERLAAKYRMSIAQAQERIDSMTVLGTAEGLALRFDRVQSTNTFDGHRLLHFAARAGKGSEMKERLLRAYFCEGLQLGDREVLATLGADVGLDASEVRGALAGDAHRSDVRADERLATELGIHGVPFFVLDGRHAVSGAQSADVLHGTLVKAWEERSASPGDGAEAAG
jgi:predicted DsbA family dithiol-disulfide isomerase